MAKDIGIHGNLFGGTLMSWIDEAAAAYVTEYCFTPNMVTVHVGELTFLKFHSIKTFFDGTCTKFCLPYTQTLGNL